MKTGKNFGDLLVGLQRVIDRKGIVFFLKNTCTYFRLMRNQYKGKAGNITRAL